MDKQACLKFVNPVGGETNIRNDAAGLGTWHAKRGLRRHKGVDLVCRPSQDVVSPIDGLVVRTAFPYRDRQFFGIVIENDWVRVKMFYIFPMKNVIGKHVQAGEVIAVAQDIAQRYGPEMKPHIHLEIEGIDPAIFLP